MIRAVFAILTAEDAEDSLHSRTGRATRSLLPSDEDLAGDSCVYRVRQTVSRLQQQLDGICEVLLGNVVIATLDPQQVGFHQHIGSAITLGGFELVAGEFDLQTIGILEIDRIHEPPITLQKLDLTLA